MMLRLQTAEFNEWETSCCEHVTMSPALLPRLRRSTHETSLSLPVLCGYWPVLTLFPSPVRSEPTRQTEEYRRIKAELDAVPAIDTHDHLWPYETLSTLRKTEYGPGMNLQVVWERSYANWTTSVTPWQDGMKFEDWWSEAKDDFDDVRATSFYQYQLPAFQDLYGIDFDRITDAQAKELDRQIYENYQDVNWIHDVVTKRANIELMFNDPHWERYGFNLTYPFEVLVLNVTPLIYGHHASEYNVDSDSPYVFAEKHGLPMETLDDYLAVLDRLFLAGKDAGAVCLKTTAAYQRTLDYARVPKERAAAAFGKRRTALSEQEIKDFQDFIMWELCERSGRYELPFQIHTGQARIQGSNPMLLVDLIAAHPETKFILFHGGYPWVGETGVILQRYWRHVWIDSVWLPQLSYSTAKRAFHEWLDAIPSNRIMWGADCNHAEGVYGSTLLTRRCVSEVLAEKVIAGDLAEDHALRIGRQILRENALELFPQLRERVREQTDE